MHLLMAWPWSGCRLQGVCCPVLSSSARWKAGECWIWKLCRQRTTIVIVSTFVQLKWYDPYEDPKTICEDGKGIFNNSACPTQSVIKMSLVCCKSCIACGFIRYGWRANESSSPTTACGMSSTLTCPMLFADDIILTYCKTVHVQMMNC